MNALSRAQAQQRADEIRTFRDELARLTAQQILVLSPQQLEAVTRHHDAELTQAEDRFDIDRDRHAKRLSLGMRVASFLGALAAAASVFFLFRQYWGLLSTSLQVVTVIGASLGSLLLAHLVGRRDATGYFAKLAAMVAFACFVLNIVMVGGIFNVTPSDAAFLPWAIVALILAYALDLKLLLAAGIACLIAFVAARIGTWSGLYWIDVGARPENFLAAGLGLFIVPHFITHSRFDGFAAMYRVFGMLAMLLPVLVLANWGHGSYLPLSVDAIERIYQLLGFVGSAGFIWLGARREWPEVVNTGLTFFVIFLYTKFYDWWWDIVPKFVFFLIIALTAILFILVMKRTRATHVGAAT